LGLTGQLCLFSLKRGNERKKKKRRVRRQHRTPKRKRIDMAREAPSGEIGGNNALLRRGEGIMRRQTGVCKGEKETERGHKHNRQGKNDKMNDRSPLETHDPASKDYFLERKKKRRGTKKRTTSGVISLHLTRKEKGIKRLGKHRTLFFLYWKGLPDRTARKS